MTKCTDCSKEVRPIVCVDIDGTLGDYHEHLRQFAEDYLGRELPDCWAGEGINDINDFWKISKPIYRDIKLAYRQGAQKRLMPAFTGASQFVWLLHTDPLINAEVWITTTRPWQRHDSVDPDTREWLRRNNIYFDHLLYGVDKYYDLSKIVDPSRVVLVLDDLPEDYDSAAKHFGEKVPVLWANNHNNNNVCRRERTVRESYQAVLTRATKRVKEWEFRHQQKKQ
jgi:uncharacterized HAD superfamily protein